MTMLHKPSRRDRLARAYESLEGLCCGDAFGERFFVREEMARSLINEKAIPAPPWKFTDDTMMAISIVSTLEEHGEIDQDHLAMSFARKAPSAMLSWLTSSDFLCVVMTLAAAAALYLWEKRGLKKESEEQWKTLIGTCRTWTPAKTKKSVEAAWITALRESVAGDPWQPGLKPSETKTRIQSRPSHCDVAEHTERTPRRAEDAERLAQAQRSLPSRNTPEPVESTAPPVIDPEVVWVHCELGDPNITKLRKWLSEGKTLFTVIVFPPADHEWEKIHEGLGRLEEVTEQEAKFRFDDVKPWTLFSNFYVGYDRKGKRPLIQFRERL